MERHILENPRISLYLDTKKNGRNSIESPDLTVLPSTEPHTRNHKTNLIL
jgi:hypothetical protein